MTDFQRPRPSMCNVLEPSDVKVYRSKSSVIGVQSRNGSRTSWRFRKPLISDEQPQYDSTCIQPHSSRHNNSSSLSPGCLHLPYEAGAMSSESIGSSESLTMSESGRVPIAALTHTPAPLYPLPSCIQVRSISSIDPLLCSNTQVQAQSIPKEHEILPSHHYQTLPLQPLPYNNNKQYHPNHSPPTEAATMPNGFPAFRFDPTTAPRYLIVTPKNSSDAAKTSSDSSQQSAENAKQSEYQHPTERGMCLP